MRRTWVRTAIAIAAVAAGCGSVEDRDGAGGHAAAGGPAGGAAGTGATDATGGGCASRLCPPSLPAPGELCDPCLQDLACDYGDCSAGAEARITARCEGVWQRTTLETCPPLCGDAPCDTDEVCLEESTGFAVSYRCAPDPCAGGALECACAAALCEAPLECTAAGEGQVTCFCDCD